MAAPVASGTLAGSTSGSWDSSSRVTRSSARSTHVRMLRGIGNIGSPWIRAGVCLQVVANRAASKHFGDFRGLGKSGPRADHTKRRTVDDTAMPEFGEKQGRTDFGRETRGF